MGFLSGAISIRLVDRILPRVHLFGAMSDAQCIKRSWRQATPLVLAITLHDIPEGLAIGVAFGAVTAGYELATLGAAIALAVGIGIENCSEGTANAVPLRREGLSRAKSWWDGQLSAAVEPVAAVAGAVGYITLDFRVIAVVRRQ